MVSTRRTVLRTVAGGGLASLAGCLGGMAHDAVLRTVETAGSQRSVAVHYEDLPSTEQEILRDAVEDGLYHACPDLPAAIRSLAGRFDGTDSLLGYRDAVYAVWLRITDIVYVSSAGPPESDPGCGLL